MTRPCQTAFYSTDRDEPFDPKPYMARLDGHHLTPLARLFKHLELVEKDLKLFFRHKVPNLKLPRGDPHKHKIRFMEDDAKNVDQRKLFLHQPIGVSDYDFAERKHVLQIIKGVKSARNRICHFNEKNGSH